MDTELEKNFRYYLDHQDELVRQYEGKVLVIKDCKVVSVHDTESEALFAAKEQFSAGTFIIQRCSPGTDDTTMQFQSRVSFAV